MQTKWYKCADKISLVPGAREKRRSAWYTLFAHALNIVHLSA